MAGRSGAWGTAGAIALAFGALVFLGGTLPAEAAVAQVRGATQAAGQWGPAIYVLGFALAMVFALPAIPFSLAAGVLFGPAAGIAYAYAGSLLGTAAAFGLARFGQRPVRAFLARRSDGLVRFLDDHSLGTVFTLRILMLPFGLTSYALGLAGVRWRAFAWGTLLGVVPPVVAFVLCGAAFGDWKLLLRPEFLVPLVLAFAATGAGAWSLARRRAALGTAGAAAAEPGP